MKSGWWWARWRWVLTGFLGLILLAGAGRLALFRGPYRTPKPVPPPPLVDLHVHTAGIGAGLGAGMGIGQVLAQAMASGMTQPTPPVQPTAAQPAANNAPTTKAQIRDALTKLDIRLANGEISETLYTKLSGNLERALESAPE